MYISDNLESVVLTENSGGEVNAYGGNSMAIAASYGGGAAIGGGNNASAETTLISGGSVKGIGGYGKYAGHHRRCYLLHIHNKETSCSGLFPLNLPDPPADAKI